MRYVSIVLSVMLLFVFAAPAMAADGLEGFFGPKIDWKERYIGEVDKNVLLNAELDAAMGRLAYHKAKQAEGIKFAIGVALLAINYDMNRHRGNGGGDDGGDDCPPPKPPHKPKPPKPPCR